MLICIIIIIIIFSDNNFPISYKYHQSVFWCLLKQANFTICYVRTQEK